MYGHNIGLNQTQEVNLGLVNESGEWLNARLTGICLTGIKGWFAPTLASVNWSLTSAKALDLNSS